MMIIMNRRTESKNICKKKNTNSSFTFISITRHANNNTFYFLALARKLDNNDQVVKTRSVELLLSHLCA